MDFYATTVKMSRTTSGVLVNTIYYHVIPGSTPVKQLYHIQVIYICITDPVILLSMFILPFIIVGHYYGV